MVNGKHMPDCGLTGNETNKNKHEKPNGVSNFFIEFSVTCDLRFVPAARLFRKRGVRSPKKKLEKIKINRN